MNKPMDFEQFTGFVQENLRDYLPSDYADAEIRIHTVQKPGLGALKCVAVMKPGEDMAKTVYLEDYHKQYKSGRDLAVTMASIAKKATEPEPQLMDGLKNIRDFISNATPEEVLANVYPRLCSRKNVPDDLVSRSFLDMGEIYYLQLEGLGYNITKSFAERVGITDEEIDEAAKENMRKQRPVLTEMRSVIDEYMGRKKSASNLLEESFFTSDTPTIRTAKQGDFPEMFVLTNKDRQFGAIHLMDQDLHKRLFEAFGEYYILPSSIHEVLIMRKDPSLDPYDLRKIVQEVNQTQVADHEILSDNVYASYGMGIKPLFDDYKKELKPPKSRKR